MATSPELELVWDGGSLDLMGENETPYGPVLIQALADGTEWGNPVSVRRALFSALADGSASALERHDNRLPVVKLRLTAADSAALAGGEMPLHQLASKKRPELRWTPPNAFAAPAAFILVESDLTHQMDDLAENRCVRTYTLSLKALPWARSIDPVTIAALPPFSAVPNVLDACTSTTGWTGASGATFAVFSGSVVISIPTPASGFVPVTLAKTLARTKRYLAIEQVPFNGGIAPPNVPLLVSTATVTITAPLAGVEGRWMFYDLGSLSGSITAIQFSVINPGGSAPTRESVAIMTIAESDVPSASAGRQSLRVIPTPGSARADGSLTIESRSATAVGGGSPLGQVIVYTGPEYDPRLSVGRADTPTTDTTALSGNKVTKTNGTFTFDVPAAGFLDGSHGLWVHAKGTNGQVVNWTVAVDAIPVGSPAGQYLNLAANTLTATTTFVGTGYNLLNLGSLDLPGFNAGEGSALGLRVRIGASGTVDLDEALVFNRSLGRLTIIDTRTRQSLLEVAGAWTVVTNGGATRVWLEAPDIGSDAPRLLAGSPSRALALPVSQDSELRSFDGTHIFNPGATFVYVGTTGVLDPLVTGTFRPAWHTHPAS